MRRKAALELCFQLKETEKQTVLVASVHRQLSQLLVRLKHVAHRLKKEATRFGINRVLRLQNQSASSATKLISFSLYGQDPRYFANLENLVVSYRKYLPDYQCRFYVGSDVNQGVHDKLASLDAEIVTMASAGTNPTYMFWRFLPADDRSVQLLLVRDVDSECSSTEALLVREWETSQKPFHIIRSHYSHNAPIMGGLWGIRPGTIRLGRHFRNIWRLRNQYGRDQKFLGRWVYPKVVDSALIHDITPGFPGEGNVVVTPVDEEMFAFVGEIAFPPHLRDSCRQDFAREHRERKKQGQESKHRDSSYWV